MKPIITVRRDDGKSFCTVSKAVAFKIRENELWQGPLVTPFMVELWLEGEKFDGMSLNPDTSYEAIANMQERFPEIVIELRNS